MYSLVLHKHDLVYICQLFKYVSMSYRTMISLCISSFFYNFINTFLCLCLCNQWIQMMITDVNIEHVRQCYPDAEQIFSRNQNKHCIFSRWRPVYVKGNPDIFFNPVVLKIMSIYSAPSRFIPINSDPSLSITINPDQCLSFLQIVEETRRLVY